MKKLPIAILGIATAACVAGGAVAIIHQNKASQTTETEQSQQQQAQQEQKSVTIEDIDTQYYSGQQKTPNIVITDDETEERLTEAVDYLKAYINNTNVGTAKVVIAFIGDYESLGVVEKDFVIERGENYWNSEPSIYFDDYSHSLTLYEGYPGLGDYYDNNTKYYLKVPGGDFTEVQYSSALYGQSYTTPGEYEIKVVVEGTENYSELVWTGTFTVYSIFDANFYVDGVLNQTYRGESINSSNIPSDPTKQDYLFLGWSTVEDDISSIVDFFSDYTLQGDTDFYAVFVKPLDGFTFLNSELESYTGSESVVIVPESYSTCEPIERTLNGGQEPNIEEYDVQMFLSDELAHYQDDPDYSSMYDGIFERHNYNPDTKVLEWYIIGYKNMYFEGADISVTTISMNAFVDNQYVETIVIQDNITHIAEDAIRCANLQTIVLNSSNMITLADGQNGSRIFGGFAGSVVFEVPQSLLATYQSTYSDLTFTAIS